MDWIDEDITSNERLDTQIYALGVYWIASSIKSPGVF